MSDASDSVRVWLVERDYDDRGVITLVYATTDGDRAHYRGQSATVMRQKGADVTAAVDVGDDDLEPIDDEETRERYAAEASRMADRHDPDAAI